MKSTARLLLGYSKNGIGNFRVLGTYDRLTAARDALADALGGTAQTTLWLELQLGGYSAWLDAPRRMVGEIVVS